MACYKKLPGINRVLNGVYSRFWKLSNIGIPQEVLSPVEYIEWQSLKVVNKISNGNYPIDKDIFGRTYNLNNRSASNQSITVQKVKYQICKESFAIRVVEDWNRMDTGIKMDPTINLWYMPEILSSRSTGEVLSLTIEQEFLKGPPTFKQVLESFEEKI